MFSCPKEGCDKKFTRGFNLDSHVLGDHEGKKPFICAHDGCGRSFAMLVKAETQIITLTKFSTSNQVKFFAFLPLCMHLYCHL